MHPTQMLDMPIHVEGYLRDQTISPQTVTWRQQKYTVIGIGRRWTEPDGVHILVELHDNSRMEIVFDVEAGWRLLRYWPVATVA